MRTTSKATYLTCGRSNTWSWSFWIPVSFSWLLSYQNCIKLMILFFIHLYLPYIFQTKKYNRNVTIFKLLHLKYLKNFLKDYAFTHSTFWLFWKLCSTWPPENPKRTLSKGKGFMLGDPFSLKSSFPNPYPHGNKHLTEFSYAVSIKWQETGYPRGAVAC